MPAITDILVRFNNNERPIRLDSQGRWNLTDILKASGFTAKRYQPSNFMRNAQTIDLIDTLNHSSDLGVEIINVVNGGPMRGSWVDERIAIAYCAWIDAAFHRAVLETFQAASRGEGEAAVEIAQKVIVREDGKITRKKFTSYLCRRGARKNEYSEMSDLVNQAVLGKKSQVMKRELGLKKHQPLRDALSEDQLLDLSICEGLAARRLRAGEGRNTRNLREDVAAGVIDFLRAIH